MSHGSLDGPDQLQIWRIGAAYEPPAKPPIPSARPPIVPCPPSFPTRPNATGLTAPVASHDGPKNAACDPFQRITVSVASTPAPRPPCAPAYRDTCPPPNTKPTPPPPEATPLPAPTPKSSAV